MTFDGSGKVKPFSAARDGSARLVTVQGGPVLIDPASGTVGRIADSGEVTAWPCTGLRASQGLQVLGSAGSSRAYVAMPDSGNLLIADLDRGACTPLPLAPAGTDFGPRPRTIVSSWFLIRRPGRHSWSSPQGKRSWHVRRSPRRPLVRVDRQGRRGLLQRPRRPDAGVVRFQDGDLGGRRPR